MNLPIRSVDEIADKLYCLPPGAFTAARDEAVAHARQAGDLPAAKRLAALKRPTQGAHLVNLLALRRPSTVGELIELGATIRTAQGNVAAAELRELSARRRRTLDDALRACRDLAAEGGSGEPTAAQLGEAEATLAAAMADDGAAELVRAGRVVKALAYAGFGGEFGATAVKSQKPPVRTEPETVPTPQQHPAQAPQPATATDRREAARAREAERAAWQRVARAEADVAHARAQESAANDELDRIADEISRLRAALDAATQRARAAKGARQAAERALTLARRDVSTEDRGRA